MTINRRPSLTVLSMFKMSTCNVKEPTHYSKRVGHEVPDVVLWLFSKCGRLGADVLKRTGPRTQKQSQVKKELCRVLDNVITFEQFPAVHLLGILKNRSRKTTKINYNIYYNFGTLLCLSTCLKTSYCYYVITPGPQDTNLLGQKGKGISKAHISYILRLKKK